MSHEDLFDFEIPSAPEPRQGVTLHPDPPQNPVKADVVPSGQPSQSVQRRSINWWALIACCLALALTAYVVKSWLPGGGGSGVDGLHVLIVEESADRMELPSKQRAILTSQVVREWLDENCTRDVFKQPAYRLYDPDIDMEGDAAVYRELMARKRKSLPWLYAVGGGGREYDGPLPETVEDLLEVLEDAK